MYQLTEALCIEDKKMQHVDFHNKRIKHAFKEVFGIKRNIDIEQIVSIPENISNERFKCRLLFTPDETSYEITAYHQREIKTLKVVYDNLIDYSFKNSNRQKLNSLYEQRGHCDDIIIVKRGNVTDAWSANLVFFDGKKWYTPDKPLLKGTQRAYLIAQKQIIEKRIWERDILNFKQVKLINAMIDFNRAPIIDIPVGIIF